jgi:hypothetical protein
MKNFMTSTFDPITTVIKLRSLGWALKCRINDVRQKERAACTFRVKKLSQESMQKAESSLCLLLVWLIFPP